MSPRLSGLLEERDLPVSGHVQAPFTPPPFWRTCSIKATLKAILRVASIQLDAVNALLQSIQGGLYLCVTIAVRAVAGETRLGRDARGATVRVVAHKRQSRSNVNVHQLDVCPAVAPSIGARGAGEDGSRRVSRLWTRAHCAATASRRFTHLCRATQSGTGSGLARRMCH